jgi:WD40 repeat protein
MKYRFPLFLTLFFFFFGCHATVKNRVVAIALSTDGKWLAVAYYNDQEVYLCNVASGKKTGHFKTEGIIKSLAITSDGHRLISLSGGEFESWEIASGKKLTKFGMRKNASNLILTRDENTFFYTSGNNAICVDIKTGKEIRSFQGHQKKIWSMALSGNGKRLATGSEDNTVRIWDVENGKETRFFDFSEDPAAVVEIALSTDAKWLFTNSESEKGVVVMWELATAKKVRTFSTGFALKLGLSSGDKLLFASRGHNTDVWETATGKRILTFKGHNDSVECFAVSLDGKFLATGSNKNDGSARVWEVQSGKEVGIFK